VNAILALTRASWLTATSYKVNTVFSFLGIIGAVVPIYFLSNALQPLMANVIRGEGHQYFGFILVGTVAFSFIPIAIQSLPSAVGSSIGNGTLEAVLSTPTSMTAVLTGMMSYTVAWTTLRGALMLVAGGILGATVLWPQIPAALLILLLIILAHLPLGLMAAASVLAFRTAGPFPRVALILSSLLGGVYYPTHVIPSWLAYASSLLPLTYGLRALRRVLLDGVSLRMVASDLMVLLAFAVVLSGIGAWAFSSALRYARRNGALSIY
jgi:ABC-2 type transport system permease protein